ncbi:MAG TPA: valine--tRNA ligase [bacterium]|nr:valine--tRNA ligase [bacterium]
MTELEHGKSYEPKSIENKWYEIWEKNDYFKAENNPDKKHFCIVIPPPNVTGQLHIGHAFNNTIQDILTRFKRMQGYDALWLPGTDHAGIATQNVVEKTLLKQKLSRHDLGREKFIEKVWEWKNEYGSRIIQQLKKLGASCDWSRLRFTMDDGLSDAVKEVFIRLYDEKLIYRGNYIVNWCPRCITALADDEVEHKELDGAFYYIKYFLKDSDQYLTIATTRPETMLGDTAVAVHPSDERYLSYIGKTVVLPLMNRELKVIADNYVDPEFGTGSLKITPAHDPNDFLIGKKHNLEEINILTDDAKMNENAGKYKGLDRFAARKRIVEDLKNEGYLIKIEPHKHQVGHCYRCKTVIEPYISKQWFVKMKPLVEPAVEAVKQGRVKFHPKNWETTYFDWMDKVRDWCISRQIWWGHRIPVWYCLDCENIIASKTTPEKCPKCGSVNLRQDDDVLDTWFSSALWPFSTLGWPDKTEELKMFYPTTVLSTAFDIIFFWVARMIIMGEHFMGDVPFKDVYIHALIRTETGEKMSKSSGNAIDPLELIENYGCDAMRFTLAALAIQGRDIKLSYNRLEGYKHFLNKIWNATRFIFMNYSGETKILEKFDYSELQLADKWILKELNLTIKNVTDNFDKYRFNDAAACLYDFIWKKFCDWYIEIVKPDLFKGTQETKNLKITLLFDVLNGVLKLLHPIIPFITEEIWQKLPEKYRTANHIMISDWPISDDEIINDQSCENMDYIIEIVTNVRNICSQNNIPPSQKVDVKFFTDNAEIKKLLENYENYISLLAKTGKLEIFDSSNKINIDNADNYGSVVLPYIMIYVEVKSNIDVKSEIERISKLIEKNKIELEKTLKKLDNQDFVSKAPKQVIEKETRKKEEFEKVIKEFTETLDKLKK